MDNIKIIDIIVQIAYEQQRKMKMTSQQTIQSLHHFFQLPSSTEHTILNRLFVKTLK